eukprot:UN23967
MPGGSFVVCGGEKSISCNFPSVCPPNHAACCSDDGGDCSDSSQEITCMPLDSVYALEPIEPLSCYECLLSVNMASESEVANWEIGECNIYDSPYRLSATNFEECAAAEKFHQDGLTCFDQYSRQDCLWECADHGCMWSASLNKCFNNHAGPADALPEDTEYGSCTTYSWVYEEFAECPRDCSQPEITLSRTVECYNLEGDMVIDDYCTATETKPAESMTCDAGATCTYESKGPGVCITAAGVVPPNFSRNFVLLEHCQTNCDNDPECVGFAHTDSPNTRCAIFIDTDAIGFKSGWQSVEDYDPTKTGGVWTHGISTIYDGNNGGSWTCYLKL